MPFYGHKFTSSYIARDGHGAGAGVVAVAVVVAVTVVAAGAGVAAMPRCVVSLDRQSNPTRGQLSCPASCKLQDKLFKLFKLCVSVCVCACGQLILLGK